MAFCYCYPYPNVIDYGFASCIRKWSYLLFNCQNEWALWTGNKAPIHEILIAMNNMVCMLPRYGQKSR